ncbi:MAG: hypothetical protein ACNA8W_13740 [Bradymonadaceae bacterium]
MVLLIPFVSLETLSLYTEAASHGTFLSASLVDVSLHLGLSACLWALGFIAYRLYSLRRRSSVQQVVRAGRGSVLMETLIVIGPFLMLTSGLAQLTILNISGVLAHLASYQATRTVWVWQPEADAGRFGVNNAQVDRRARLAAAAIMAPTAPVNYRVQSESGPEFEALRATMFATFSNGMSDGNSSRGDAAAASSGGNQATSERLHFQDAFDTSNFDRRAARKLTYAYAATEVTVGRSGGDVTTRLHYRQSIVFPWFSYIWGEEGDVGGRGGRYVSLHREFSLPKQVGL